jgi:CheY-like chemotaxis protein
MRTIAIIEDNEDNRLLLNGILEDFFTLVEFEDGPRAIAALPGAPPDLLLMDISLPGMDGVAVLAKLREFPGLKNVPAIALTAHAMEGDRERFLAAGFDDYVAKPIVDETWLLTSIQRALSRVPPGETPPAPV